MLVTPVSPALAATLAPAKIKTDWGMAEDEVRELLASAIQVAYRVGYHLVRLSVVPDESIRAQKWNSGLEEYWFAQYDREKMEMLQTTFDRIPAILEDPSLKINCDRFFMSYAEALPGIRKIRLGQYWYQAGREERIQTFIHESAHIAGRFVAREKPWYERPNAHNMAHTARPRRPRMMMRSAENYGYYAIDTAADFANLAGL